MWCGASISIFYTVSPVLHQCLWWVFKKNILCWKFIIWIFTNSVLKCFRRLFQQTLVFMNSTWQDNGFVFETIYFVSSIERNHYVRWWRKPVPILFCFLSYCFQCRSSKRFAYSLPCHLFCFLFALSRLFTSFTHTHTHTFPLERNT